MILVAGTTFDLLATFAPMTARHLRPHDRSPPAAPMIMKPMRAIRPERLHDHDHDHWN
jgi:hypothetical protein